MKSHEPFFIVEDSLDQKLDGIAPLIHDDLSKSDYLEHFDLGKIFKSKSKYKGGFKKGKNTKEYNHDYYIHNKDKWKKDGETEEMTLDELKELGLTDEQIEALNLDRDAKGVFIVPTEWIEKIAKGGIEAINDFVKGFKDTLSSLFKKEEDKPEPVGPKSPFLEDPKTIDDPQNAPLYEVKYDDERKTEDLPFDYAEYYEDFAVKDEPMSVAEDCASVNPNYPYDEHGNVKPKVQEMLDDAETVEDYLNIYDYVDGYTQNCAWCTYTYELRRRGYDVQAPLDSGGLFNSDIVQFYDGVTLDDVKVPEYTTDRKQNTINLFKELEKEGNGARGNICVKWDDGTGSPGGGHSMAWEVVDGRAYIIDTQTNTVMDVDKFYKRDGYRILWDSEDYWRRSGYNISPEVAKEVSGCTYLRTDNKELNTSGKITRVSVTLDASDINIQYDEYSEVYLKDHIVSNEPTQTAKNRWKALKMNKPIKKTGRKKRRKRNVY